ncbi:MAG: DNA polymerase/3'-5' exonuclease PolX [Planctomycetota bacterium]
MTFNERLSEVLAEMATLLELSGGDRFRVNAHAKAARTIRDSTTDLEPIAEDAKALTALDGIGKGMAEKIGEFKRTGTLEDHESLLAEIPPGLLDVMGVQGLGPKTVRAMWKDLDVTDLDGLSRVIDSGELASLPRMGAKAVEKIRTSLKFLESTGTRLHVGVALPVAEKVVEFMASVEGVTRVEHAGSLRRGKETIGDVDVLCVAKDPKAAHEAFRGMEGVVDVIASGETKSSVRLAATEAYGRWKGFEADGGITVQVDLRTVPKESWGAALMYFTGSKEHNVKMRERALAKGLTLNEYGLFPDDDPKAGSPQSRGIEPVASGTEKDVFRALDLKWVPPEMREDRGELGSDVPEPIEVKDIKAELHAHTTASDGKMELEELVQGAIDRGFHTIAVTDHSKSSAQAGGLNEQRLEEQAEMIDQANEMFGDITVMKGSEVDILADGSLDFDDETLAKLDVVVASPHASLDQDPVKATERMLKAIANPFVHVIGHPTGRILSRRPGLPLAMDEIIASAKEHDVALEINAHWLRLDLRDTHVRAAVEAGVKIAIDCDVHAMSDFSNLKFGVMTGRRGWLTKDLCVNAWSKTKLHKWLRSKR